MMINILIDTCSWIDLLTEGQNKLLPQIEFWRDNNCINLITHEVIIEEWNKHKEKQKKRFMDASKTKYNHAKEIIKKENLYIPDNIEPNIENINCQIATIDKMLDEAIVLKTSDDIKLYCIDRTISPHKAPFHNKLDSTKDAYIIFSTLKYFKEIHQNFIFISSNKDDFGSPPNLTREIHPEILEDYCGIKINYFSEIGRAISELKNELPLVLITTNDTTAEEGNFLDEVIIDKTKPILDQVYDYVSIRHKEIEFVPLHIFTQNYPFKNLSNSYLEYSVFNLTTDNQELFELFKSIDFSKEDGIKLHNDKFYQNVLNYEEKLKKVISSLTQNLIFNISNSDTRENITIRYSENTICNCPKCNYERFKFVDSFNSLYTYSDSVKDLLELAYVNYQIGNFLESCKNIKLAYTKSVSSTLKTSAFISQFNLSKLIVFIKNYHYRNNNQLELVDELKKIKLSDLSKSFATKENNKIINWICDNKFYLESRDKIQSSVSKIIDQYYSQLGGGWSSNSEIWKLINDYAGIDAFLNVNNIIYDRFKEYRDLSNVFFEGLFASHAIEESHQSRLESFDDWLIIKMLNYSDPDTLNKLFNRYKLKSIKYKETSTSGDSLNNLIDNFFNENSLLRETFKQTCEKDNIHFWEYYNKIFNNILTIVSLCDLDSQFYNSFSEKLLNYLETESYIRPQNIKYVRIFLLRIGKKIDTKILSRFFLLIINNNKYHNEDFIETLSDKLIERKEKLNLTQSQFEDIKNIAFEECNSCKVKHSNTMIIPFYRLIQNELYKTEIQSIINQQLKESFNFNLFYLATIFDIIDFNQELFKVALDFSFRKEERVSMKSIFTGKEDNRFDLLNHIINLCFKYGINTNDSEYNKFKELDDYYCWLLDMEGFNYDNFKPSWIGEYGTKYYYKKIGTNAKVKKVLDKLLGSNFDSIIEREYLNIFIRKTWDDGNK